MDYSNDAPQPSAPEYCTAMIPVFTDMDTNSEPCGKEIKTMAWRGTGVCGDLHRKVKAGGAPRALTP